MKIIITALGLLLLLQPAMAQKTYATSNGFASFYSKAPVSDVDARDANVNASLNTSTGALKIEMNMADFKFRNRKMGRDAEKKYLETQRYTEAGFDGKITGDIDYKKPGTYPATAKGVLKIHGKEKEISEKGTITVGKGKITLASEFYVRLKDYDIETPSIMGHEMTEDKVLVKFRATLLPGK
ncbi:MAG TPA: YceI family protein [Chryseosolibacter sp.]